MIFSQEKWNNAGELKKHVKVSAAITYETLYTSLNNAFNLFLRPLLGEAMVDELIEIYKYGPDPNTLGSTSESVTSGEKKDYDLLMICQRANANLALWYDFDEINTRISDAGFQRQESADGTIKQIYKYQDNNLRRNFKNKGFNALDEVIAFLERNIDRYPEFKTSETYVRLKSAIVRSTAEVDKIYYINSSRILFLRLQTHFDFVSEEYLRTNLGDLLYDQLIAWCVSDYIPDDLKDKVEELRVRSGRVVVMGAVRRLINETGSLTDRGLYFSSIKANADGDESEGPIDDTRLQVQINQVNDSLQAYITQLIKFVRRSFPEHYVGNPIEYLSRDNDDKMTFWA